jgi:hypothetical protein
MSIAEARAVAERNGLRLPAAYARNRDVFPIDLLRSSRRNSVLRLLGVLASYRAITNSQAAAFVGDVAFADPRSGLVTDLFRSGLINLSPAHLNYGIGSFGHGAAVYTLGSPKKVLALRDVTTYAEWLAVSGNRPLARSRVNVRHDVLAAELALRLSQLPGVGTVLGPHFSTFADLLPGTDGARAPQGGPDLVMVRNDGLRIAIEVTATIGQHFKAKVDRWARRLAAGRLDKCGLAVVFIAAPTLEDRHGRGDYPRRTTYREVARATRQHPGIYGDRTAERMGVATWREWFPGPLLASERFTRLTVDRPVGREPLWEECDLLDRGTLPVTGEDTRSLRSTIVNAALLAQTPSDLRGSHRPADLNVDLLRASVGPVHAVEPLRDRSSTRSVGAGQGAAADSYLPARLLGPTADAPTPHHLVAAPSRSPSDWPLPARRVKRRTSAPQMETLR